MTTYGYDGASRLNGVGQGFAYGVGDDTTALTYNPASQIASRASSNDAFAYAGHANGTTAETPDGLNRVTSVNGVNVSYDTRGNVTSDGTNNYGYDPENRLVSSSVFGGTTLIYDPLGRLWSLASPVWGKTQFVYDRGQVAVEYDIDTGGVRRRYFWGPGVDEPVLQDDGGAMNCSGTKFLHGDERGSIVGVADCNGNRTNANTYDDYGNGASGNWGRYQYTGQAWLQELGLYNYKNRMYSARLGRFMQTDPIGYGDGMNLYGYVKGDPVNWIDPTGTSCTQKTSTTFYDTDGNGVFSTGEKIVSQFSWLEGDTCSGSALRGSSGASAGSVGGGGGSSGGQSAQPGDIVVIGRCDAVCQANLEELRRVKYLLSNGRYQLNPNYVDPYPWLNLENIVKLEVGLFAAAGGLAVAPVVRTTLFSRGTGWLNSNNVLRIGDGWKGTATQGREFFRLSIGNKKNWSQLPGLPTFPWHIP